MVETGKLVHWAGLCKSIRWKARAAASTEGRSDLLATSSYAVPGLPTATGTVKCVALITLMAVCSSIRSFSRLQACRLLCGRTTACNAVYLEQLGSVAPPAALLVNMPIICRQSCLQCSLVT